METIRADCRKALRDIPAGSVDAVVTGVPFWSSKSWGWDGAIGQEGSFPNYLSNMKDVFWELWRVTSDEAPLWVVAGDCRDRSHLFQPGRLLPVIESVNWSLADAAVWSYRFVVPHFQMVFLFRKWRASHPVRIPSEHGFVWDIEMDQGDPVAFPQALVDRMIELSDLTHGSTILDPFAGSGTVAKSATGAGHSAILIDGRTNA